jgi:8-amino-7-oxononanoate synthase
VTDHLVDAARSMIFDTGLAPASAAAALAALRLIRQDPGLPRGVRANALELHRICRELGLDATVPTGAVTSVLVGDPSAAVAAAARCAEQGVRVGCFRPPSVPDGISRLRLTARATLREDELGRAATALATALAGAVRGARTVVASGGLT